MVVKPSDLDGGLGVHVGLDSEAQVRSAFSAVSNLSKSVLVEQFVPGQDYRLRVCEGEVIGVVIRRPAGVVGDGCSTVQSLIEKTNQERLMRQHALEPEVEQGHKPILVDDEVHQWLRSQGFEIGSVIPSGVHVRLRGAANVNLGGTTWDVTHRTHPDNIALAIEAVAALRLDLAGVDLLIPDISMSWRESKGVICEVNAQPQYSSNDAHGEVLKRLTQKHGRIPVVGLVGTPTQVDLYARLVRPLQQVGIKLVVNSETKLCRRALFDVSVDALVYAVADMPAAPEVLAVDRLGLLIDLRGKKEGSRDHMVWPHDELWTSSTGEADLDMLLPRIIEYIMVAAQDDPPRLARSNTQIEMDQ